MGFKNPFVFSQESRQRHGLGRGEGEVIEYLEYPTISFVLAIFNPRGVQSLSQRFACRGGLGFCKAAGNRQRGLYRKGQAFVRLIRSIRRVLVVLRCNNRRRKGVPRSIPARS
jgi:hypothetical protein